MIKFRQELQRIVTLYRKPSQYFASIQKESILRSMCVYLLLYSIFLLLYFILICIFMSVSNQSQTPNIAILLLMGIFVFIFGLISAIAYLFINAGVIHLGLMVAKAKKTYLDTFKCWTYSNISITIDQILFITGVIVAALICTAIQSHINENIVGFLVLISILLFGILNTIHFFYVLTIGLAQTHLISKGRALLGATVPLIIMIMIFASLYAMIFILSIAAN